MNHALSTRFAAVAVVAALTVAGAGAARATTVAHTSAGTTRLYATDSGKARSPILFTGVVGDYGSVPSVDRAGRPDPDGRPLSQYGSITGVGRVTLP